MIIELTKDNISEIDNSFINVSEILNEFENNPFAKILIYKENEKVIGYLYYSDIYDRAEINQFEVEISHRNCGKGKKLLNHKEHLDKEVESIIKDYISMQEHSVEIYKKYL